MGSSASSCHWRGSRRGSPASRAPLPRDGANELLANCAIYSTTLDLTQAANALAAEGWHIDPDDLATISPYITTAIRRFGDWVLNLTPPAKTADGHLALAAASGQ